MFFRSVPHYTALALGVPQISVPVPQELLVARLGWGVSGVNHPCVSQTRDRACAANRRRITVDQDDNAVLNFDGAADEEDSAYF